MKQNEEKVHQTNISQQHTQFCPYHNVQFELFHRHTNFQPDQLRSVHTKKKKKKKKKKKGARVFCFFIDLMTPCQGQSHESSIKQRKSMFERL